MPSLFNVAFEFFVGNSTTFGAVSAESFCMKYSDYPIKFGAAFALYCDITRRIKKTLSLLRRNELIDCQLTY